VLLPDSAADFTGFLQGIRGAREFFQWRQKQTAEFAAGKSSAKDAQELWLQAAKRFEETVGVRAPDDRTLVVELENPIPYFPDLCAFPSLFPVYPPVVSQYEQPDPRTGLIRSRSDWTKPPRLVTNGPMKLTVWRFKRDMRFEKNEHYWGREAVPVDSINMPSIADQNAQVLAFQTGAVDVVIDASARYRSEIVAQKQVFYAEHREEYERLKAEGWDQFDIDRHLPSDPRKNVHVVPMFGTYFYNFNCRAKLADGRANPFADARVRRAFAMAVDRRVLTGEVLRMGNLPAYTLIPPGSIAGYEGPKGCVFDPAGARKLLAEAGYPSGKSFPITVDILFNKEGEHDRIAQFVAKEWERNLGVSVSLTPKEIRVFREDLKNGNFITSRAGWYGDYGDPTSFLDTSRSWDGNNDRKFNNPEYDELLRRAAAEPDAAARMKLLAQAERMLMEVEQPMMPLYQQATMYLMDVDRISGLSCHARTVLLLGGVDVLGDGKGPDRPRGMPRIGSGAAESPQAKGGM